MSRDWYERWVILGLYDRDGEARRSVYMYHIEMIDPGWKKLPWENPTITGNKDRGLGNAVASLQLSPIRD